MTDPRDEKLAEAGNIMGIIANIHNAFIASVTALGNHSKNFNVDGLRFGRFIGGVGNVASIGGAFTIDDPDVRTTEVIKAFATAGVGVAAENLFLVSRVHPLASLAVGSVAALGYAIHLNKGTSGESAIGSSIEDERAPAISENGDIVTATFSNTGGDATVTMETDLSTGVETITGSNGTSVERTYDSDNNPETIKISVDDKWLEINVQTGEMQGQSGTDPVVTDDLDNQTADPDMQALLEAIETDINTLLANAEEAPTVSDFTFLSGIDPWDLNYQGIVVENPLWVVGGKPIFLPVTEDKVTFIQDIEGKFGDAEVNGSPLVLDLDDSGTIDLISLANSSAWWDLSADGFATHSGWVSSVDGLLAYDANQNQRIENNSELFGSMDTDGFTELGLYDSNQDGLIDSGDAIWEDLLIWQDFNEDGFADSLTEVFYLSDYDIVSIDLNATEVSQTNQGNAVSHTSTFTVDDGVNPASTQAIHDVWFATDTVNSYYSANYTPDIRTSYMPELHGYGTLPNLRIAMSLDNDLTDPDSLLSLVKSLTFKSLSNIFTDDSTILSDVTDIMYRWAGVDSVATDSRGPNIDARKLEFLEKMMGQDFLQRGYMTDPGPLAAVDLEEAFHIAQKNIFARLLAQTAGSDLFTYDTGYDLGYGKTPLEVFSKPAYDHIGDQFWGITGLNQSTIDTLETQGMSEASPDVFWANVVRVIEYTVGVSNLSTGDQIYLDDAIFATDNSLSLSGIVASLAFDAPDGSTYNGTTGDDTLTGGTGYDILNGDYGNDTLHGGIGNDTLNGEGDNDILYGESGNDYLKGGLGNDEYHWAAGQGEDTILERGGGTGNDDDRIVLGAGFDSGDLTLTRASNSDMLIEIDNGTQTGRIVIEDYFNYAAGGGHVELIEFSDQSTYDLDGQSWTLNGTAGADTLWGVKGSVSGTGEDTIYGGAGNDTIHSNAPNETDTQENWLYGEDGNDFLEGSNGTDHLYGGNGDDELRGQSGADVLYAGAGNDIMRGWTGDDVYHYVSGQDVIDEEGGTADEIQLDATWNGSSPQYLKFGTDLQIWFDAANTITIQGYYASTGNKVETLKFQDTTTVDLSTVSTAQMGDDNNNNLFGTANDDVIFGLGGNDNVNAFSGNDGNDTLYGGAGDDVLWGGNGNDYLDGGSGDDDLRGGANNDTYIYSSGVDILREGGGTDVVELVEGWTPQDITFRRDLTDHQDLQIIFSPVNSIRLQDQFVSGDRFETLRFSDNSTINLLTLQVETHGNEFNNNISGIAFNASNEDIMFGYAGNDTLDGNAGDDVLYGGTGNDVLWGGTGDDTIYGEAGGDDMRGEAGNDIYIFDGGLDKIIESSSDLGDVLKVTGGVTINDISMVDSGTVDAKMIVNSGVDEITLINLRGSGTWSRVETGEFDDGFTVDLRTYQSWINGTASDETLNGTSGDDTLIGFAGNDTVNAGAGADAAHGGTGADTLHGGDGADLLHGGAGDDILYGEDGLDTLFGGAGADDFIFESTTAFNNVDVIKDFSLAENDALDISDILDTVYDPLTDLITDFVQITDNGTDSTLSIDRDGTGATYSFDSVATILGVTGLTDEAALENTGHLITA